MTKPNYTQEIVNLFELLQKENADLKRQVTSLKEEIDELKTKNYELENIVTEYRIDNQIY